MNACMPRMILLLILVSLMSLTTADYECVCNYHGVEAAVHSSPSDKSPHIGSLYEFDCKPTYTIAASLPQWQAVQFEKQVGFVSLDSQSRVQTCQGVPSQVDIVGAATTIKTTLTSAKTPATKQIFSLLHATRVSSSSSRPFKPSATSSKTGNVVTVAYKPKTSPTATTTVAASKTLCTTIFAKTTTNPVLPSTKTTIHTTRTTSKITTAIVTTSKISTPRTVKHTLTTKKSTPRTTKSTSTTINTTTARTLQCPPQVPRTRNQKEFRGRCYEFILGVHKNWPDAEKECNRKGGHLVSIRSKAEQDFVYRSLGELHFHGDDGVWIGLTDQHHESRWTWSSGEQNTFTYWAKSQPGIGGSFEDCALMLMSEKGHWGDYSCKGILFTHQRHGYVCEYNKV